MTRNRHTVVSEYGGDLEQPELSLTNNMKLQLLRRKIMAAGGICLLSAGNTFGQSADALIDKLVQKGILTVKEGNDLREESDKNFSQAYTVKSGLPDYVSSLRISGDIRGRYEGFYSGVNYEPITGPEKDWTDRNRFRYRMRLGVTATLFDNFEVGVRLTSSDPASGDAGYGGDPISGNTTLQNNASKKFVYIDQAYGKWYFANGGAFSGNVAIGKIENPLLVDDMVFDPDYTPEGLGIQSAYQINSKNSIKLNLGGFIVDEIASSSSDPYILGAQVRWDSAWTKKWAGTFGATWLTLQNGDRLTNTITVPNQSTGNTRSANGVLVYDYNPYVLDAAVTYTLDSFPFYKGAFPVRLGGEFMQNPSAPSSADNYAWNAGITFGKAGKRGTWELNYVYKWLGADAWWEEVVDSDFGAFYARTTTFPGPTSGAGYTTGTNVKGHIVRLAYSPTDSLTLSAKWFLTELIEPFPAGANSEMNRIQLDASLKF
jgi:hypothetical protein